MVAGRFRAVLFDLDGTLADTAPDLVGSLNRLRLVRQLAALDESELRPLVTRGAAGLIEAGFGSLPADQFEALRGEFLEHYRANLWVHSRGFPGIDSLLGQLKKAGLSLGIVTNKIESLAEPVVKQAGWHHLFGCLVAGDTTERSKPDPMPVVEACRRLNMAPGETVFVGDDRRDVLAGKAAGCFTVVASWGYIDEPDSIAAWNADAIIDHPSELIGLLEID